MASSLGARLIILALLMRALAACVADVEVHHGCPPILDHEREVIEPEHPAPE